MVEFVKISIDHLQSCIYNAFDGDFDLLHKYHISPGGVYHCVRDTFEKIREVADKETMEYYALVHESETIGFTVIGESFLFSFGISITYRSKEVVLGWWRKVCSLLNDEFATWIWKKNDRTLKFLLRNGMEIIDDKPENEFYNLIYIICPQED